MQHIVELFVMQGCSVCPTMERIFQRMLNEGVISELKLFDVGRQRDLAEQYSIRSVPYYRIDGKGFSGLRPEAELRRLLVSAEGNVIAEWMAEQLREGGLKQVEDKVLQNRTARQALVRMLENPSTELVIRIGLSAVIEALVEQRIFDEFEDRFIELSRHHEARIAIDALYYLQLISTPSTLQQLQLLAAQDDGEIAHQARELLAEATAGAVAH
jgi:hypothetical protein